MKVDLNKLKVRDEVTRLEHFNRGVGVHKSLKNKLNNMKSKESKKELNKIRKEYI